MVGVTDDELVVHATPFTVGARVGDHCRVQAVEADVGVLTFVDPTNLNAIGGGGIHGIFYGLVVQIVGSHIQRVLRTHDPRSHGVVHVRSEGEGQFVCSNAVVDRAVEVHVNVSRALRHRRVRTNGGHG